MAETFPLPTAAEAMRTAVNKSSKKSKTIDVPDNQKLAIVVLPLQPAVTSGDYPALKTAIEGLAGIQAGVTLVIDGITRPSVEAGYEQVLVTDVHLRTREVPEP